MNEIFCSSVKLRTNLYLLPIQTHKCFEDTGTHVQMWNDCVLYHRCIGNRQVQADQFSQLLLTGPPPWTRSTTTRSSSMPRSKCAVGTSGGDGSGGKAPYLTFTVGYRKRYRLLFMSRSVWEEARHNRISAWQVLYECFFDFGEVGIVLWLFSTFSTRVQLPVVGGGIFP